MASRSQQENGDVGLVMAGNLRDVLDTLDRDLLLIKRRRDREFVKVYTERWLSMFPTGEMVGLVKPRLSWDERALLATLMPLVDYETNMVLSPQYCFDNEGRRQKRTCLPATEEEIARFADRSRPAVRKILDSLEEKGFIQRINQHGRRGAARAIRLSEKLVYRGALSREGALRESAGTARHSETEAEMEAESDG